MVKQLIGQALDQQNLPARASISTAQQVAGIKACFSRHEPEPMLQQQNRSAITICLSDMAGVVRYGEGVARGRIGINVCYTCGTQAILAVAKSLFLLL